MAHTLVQPHQHGGILKRSMGSNAGLRKVDDALLCEDHAQLCDGVSQDDEDVACGAPLLFAVFRGWMLTTPTGQREEDLVRPHPLHQRCKTPPVARSVLYCDGASLPPRLGFREQQATQG